MNMLGNISKISLIIAFVGIFIFMIFSGLAVYSLPGLYMDAVNPEYMAPLIFPNHASTLQAWVVPGNLIHGFPVLGGSIYHGATQLYAALPFFYLFGISLHTFRATEAFYAFLIVLLAYLAMRQFRVRSGLALVVTIFLCVDPSFYFTFPTQAYSTIFPILFMLGAIILFEYAIGKGDNRRIDIHLVFSSLLIGIASFSYFEYLFFLPGLMAYVYARTLRGQPSSIKWHRLSLCSVGFLVGYSPLVVGLCLIAKGTGGFDNALHWLKISTSSLNVSGSQTGILARVESVYRYFAQSLTASWHSLTFFHMDVVGIVGALKALFILGIIVLGVIANRTLRQDKTRANLFVYLILSFLLISSIFGGRLGGHHFTVLIPILYIALAISVENLFTFRDNNYKAIQSTLYTRSLLAGMTLILLTSLMSLLSIGATLERTRGIGLYSDAINAFADNANRSGDNITYLFPQWGLFMPFQFITRGRFNIGLNASTTAIASALCSGHSVRVAYIGRDWQVQAKQLMNEKTAVPSSGKVIYRQKNGEPIIGVVQFSHKNLTRAREKQYCFK